MLIHLRTGVWTLKVLLWAPVKVWFYSVQGYTISFYREWEINDLSVGWLMKTLWKSSRLIYKCSNFALFCCQKSNSFRPWHRALIEGVIFLKYINAVYVIFFSYRGRWYVMSERLSVFTHDTKKASRLRDCVIPKTHFFARWNFTIDRPFSQ